MSGEGAISAGETNIPDRNVSGVPPPVPPRPSTVSGGYSEVPYSYYGSYGPGSYGNVYSSPYARYGMPHYYPPAQENNMVRMAEESSRPAFQSLESVVQAVASVSMMLESSYTAIYSSFRAVLGVADQFSRLKAHFTHILSTLAVIRIVSWLWRRLLVLLRLKPANYANSSAELAWNRAQLNDFPVAGKSNMNWSSLIFFVVTIGGPWLIWKILSKISAHIEKSRRWARGMGDHFEARVLYSFNGVDESELSVVAGSTIRIAPKELQPSMRGWLMAANLDGQKIGLVPMNYVEITRSRSIEDNLLNDHELENAW